MIRRPRRSIPATIVALLLLAMCVLVVLCCVQALLGQTPLISFTQLLAVGSGQSWDSAVVVTLAVATAVLGLVLLVAAIRPGNPTVMPLVPLSYDGATGSDAGVRRHSLVRDLTTTAEAVPGVTKATVDAGRRRIVATVAVAAADPAAVPDTVRGRLEYRLVEIGPAPRPKVRIRARRDDAG
ncbi:hypothetical protein Acsp06_51050 [Actinomycetospora sp. NBRC 106375]|uniref:DUF6286 domain-containing protein n=1 Tax=Actinomycetospora sp. NBRC 106375 TaxID=3032207 RepID=UPI0024A37045|nr:DUF6286 domain-containing protein [Actinomycetospora sp. NBRC 106375]GLZ48920.1 hypothetical protein Acsp06_51050 [Actinomycetospora sp. NBRC 106375]